MEEKVNIFYILRFSYTSFINIFLTFSTSSLKAHIKLTKKFKSKMHPNKIKKNNQNKIK